MADAHVGDNPVAVAEEADILDADFAVADILVVSTLDSDSAVTDALVANNPVADSSATELPAVAFEPAVASSHQVSFRNSYKTTNALHFDCRNYYKSS